MFEIGEVVRLRDPREISQHKRESQHHLGNTGGWLWVYEGSDPDAWDCGVFRSVLNGRKEDGWLIYRFKKMDSDDAAA